jgi:hypothetical protein
VPGERAVVDKKRGIYLDVFCDLDSSHLESGKIGLIKKSR